MHPINGLQLDQLAKEQYHEKIDQAQRELYAQSMVKGKAPKRFAWLRTLLAEWSAYWSNRP